MTKKVEEFLIEKKENLQELMANISSKTNEVASKIKSTAKNATAKVAEFIEDNKSTAKKLAAGIGAAAVVTTSAMGLAGCDELQPGGLIGEFLEQHTETDSSEIVTNIGIDTSDTMISDDFSDSTTTETPTPVINFTYEECEELFYELFYKEYPELSGKGYTLERASLTYNNSNNKEWGNGQLIFTQNSQHYTDFQYLTFYNIPITLELFCQIRDGLPEKSLTIITKEKLDFNALLTEIPNETKTELCNYIANQIIKEHPELLEDETEMQQ